MKMEMEQLEDDLVEITRALDSLSGAHEPPLTTLQVVGRAQRERFWQRLLVYLLSPNEPHGLDEELLEYTLDALTECPRTDFSYSTLSLESVQLEEEAATEDGRPDLVIWCEDDWFICIEMKVGAVEGDDQTQRYVDTPRFDSIGVEKADIEPRSRHYVYLAPRDARPPEAEEFVHLDWEDTADLLEGFVRESAGRHSSRTESQIYDFVDTIRSELTMTDYKQNQREKAALAMKYHNSVTTVGDALKSFSDDLEERWPDWVEVPVLVQGDGWNLRQRGKYVSAFRDEWAIDYGGESSDVGDSDLLAYWAVKLHTKELGPKGVFHRLNVGGSSEKLLEEFARAYSDPAVKNRVSECVVDTKSTPKMSVESFEWDSKGRNTLVEGNYKFDLLEMDYGDAYAETFESMIPIFEIITDCMPPQTK